MEGKDKRQGLATIQGNSMLPTLRPGDQVVVEYGQDGVRCGDLATLRVEGRLVVHRVISRGPPLVTRGDNSPRIDDPSTQEQLLGRVIDVRREGESLPQRRRLDFVLGGLSRVTSLHPRLRRIYRVALRSVNWRRSSAQP